MYSFEKNINNMVNEGKLTGPVSRYLSSWSLFIIYTLFVVSIVKGDYLISAFIIIPFLWHTLSIAYIIIFFVSGKILYGILITLFFVTNISSIHFGRKFASSLFSNSDKMYEDIQFRSIILDIISFVLITVICINGFNKFGMISLFIFLSIEIITLYKIINHVKNVRSNLTRNKHDNLFSKLSNNPKTHTMKTQFEGEKTPEKFKEFLKNQLSDMESRTIMQEENSSALRYEADFIVEDFTEKHFRKDGSLILECKVDQGGIRNGDFVAYFSNGIIYSKGSFSNGILHGELKNYFINGNLSFSTTMNNGRENGDSKLYSENGKIQTHKVYQNGTVIDEKYFLPE